jgi:hypothetical protein
MEGEGFIRPPCKHLTVGVEGFRNASTWMVELLVLKRNVPADGVFMKKCKNKGKDSTPIYTAKITRRICGLGLRFSKQEPRARDTASDGYVLPDSSEGAAAPSSG